MLRENAQAERVLNPTTTYPPLDIEEYPEMDVGTLQGTPIINSEDNSNSSRPAANTRYQRKVQTITQDYLFHLMDTSFLPGQLLFTSKQASSRILGPRLRNRRPTRI